MTTNEQEMVRTLDTQVDQHGDRFTSLQPTYEDTVAPDPENDWELDR